MKSTRVLFTNIWGTVFECRLTDDTISNFLQQGDIVEFTFDDEIPVENPFAIFDTNTLDFKDFNTYIQGKSITKFKVTHKVLDFQNGFLYKRIHLSE